MHCFLGRLYNSLDKELSDELKIKIEKEKLEQRGKEYLWDYCTKNHQEVLKNLPGKGKNNGENANAFIELMESSNIRCYSQSNNYQRENFNLKTALELSGENPTVFKHFIKLDAEKWLLKGAVPRFLAFADGLKQGRYISFGYNPADSIIALEYEHAKERLGFA